MQGITIARAQLNGAGADNRRCAGICDQLRQLRDRADVVTAGDGEGFAVMGCTPGLPEPAFDGLGCPGRRLLLVAGGAGVRGAGLVVQVGTRNAQGVIAARVHAHVGAGRHMATDTLRTWRPGWVMVVLRTVVVLLRQAGEAWIAGRRVTGLAQVVAFGAQGGHVRLVAIAAGHALGEHLALGEGAVFEDFIEYLPVRVVQALRQHCGAHGIQQRLAGLTAVAQRLAPAVAASALLDFVALLRRVEIDRQPHGGGAGCGLRVLPLLFGPVDMALAGAMAALAAHGHFAPGGGEGVVEWVVAFLQIAGMAIGAHGVPVLVTAGPVQGVIEAEALARIQREPALPALLPGPAVPGDGQALQTAAGAFDQVLLEGCDAEGVGDGEVCGLAVFALGVDEKAPVALEEAHVHTAVVVEWAVVEVTEHVAVAGFAQRPTVVRGFPGLGLGLVTAVAALLCDIAIGKLAGGRAWFGHACGRDQDQ